MTKPVSLDELSVQPRVIAALVIPEKVRLDGTTGMGGVKPYFFPETGFVVTLASVVELTLVPALFTERKLPDPVVVAAIPIEAEGILVPRLSGRYTNSIFPVASYNFAW